MDKKAAVAERIVKCESCAASFPEDHMYVFQFDDPNIGRHYEYRLCPACGGPVVNILHLITLQGMVPQEGGC